MMGGTDMEEYVVSDSKKYNHLCPFYWLYLASGIWYRALDKKYYILEI